MPIRAVIVPSTSIRANSLNPFVDDKAFVIDEMLCAVIRRSANHFSSAAYRVDTRLPPGLRNSATRRIVSAHPDVVVFLCSTYDVEDLPPGAADSGASAYVNKERFGAETLRQLWAARDSGSFATA